ncbi:MAG: Co2+/Mg2+ efflux protein ApaG [Methylophilaceae bacterium]|jgi:ApaG protein|nr:Co2+/Mg2+ efflux protein ApaG [Methylophilaceae bacterium]
MTETYLFSVHVETAYLADQSSEEGEHYTFSYTVTITNTGNIAAQLISRHWVITDADNQVSEVKGLGVIGEQPLLEPGEHFTYTSGTALNTAVGQMRGRYHIVAVDGTSFEAEIPPFILATPRVLH